MKFRIASILSNYTNGEKYIEFDSNNLIDALKQLDNKYPGIKFRFINEQNNIRPHMNLFLNNEIIRDLNIELKNTDEIFIVQSLSGG